jgi:glycosyltransferase involved in cell wall biosynthesis
MTRVDVLIPTRNRPVALAVTLATLIGQDHSDLRVVISDQSDEPDTLERAELKSVIRLLNAMGRPVEVRRHLPRRGMAEQRQFLLEQASAPFGLFLDDDVLLEPDLLSRLLATIQRERCGFVGSALIGLSYADDVRPQEQVVEPWDGPVRPERVLPGSPEWERHRLHNAANLLHVQRRLVPPGQTLTYKVAWVGGCVLYDLDALRDCGGFGFWTDLPQDHAGEDVLAQLRVMDRYGGCAILPSGAYHQELPTTVHERSVDAPWVLR